MNASFKVVLLGLITFFPLGMAEVKNSENIETMLIEKNPTPVSTLTITKLKKPWYAWRSIVAGKMEETIPEYRTVKGLSQKYYFLTSDHMFVGGIYLWETKKDSEIWFDDDWFTRMEEKYGQEAILDSYEIVEIISFEKANASKGSFYGAISYASGTPLNWPETGGPIKVFQLKDGNGQVCHFSLWHNEDAAKDFLDTYGVTNRYFDVPLIMNPE